ncbi:RNA polymerase sigma factor [Aquimarina celericrescens]|uniref:RNA polymerase sigma factor n=1 Tax=Aquimarina celericrescens TaxID=1964542 RepID=A0ABW5AXL8_9FLAO|nr:sigma-70 family RNA polymerase sigma factor [Aquimarina celericrescens]
MSENQNQNICTKKVFKEIYDRYAKEIHDYLYYKYGARFNPDDKTQETFIKLWENCKKIEFKAAKAFLYKVANNLTLNEVKHFKVVLKYQKIPPKYYTNESPEFLMEKEQFLGHYEKALSSLTEEQRICFVLNKIEGKTHKEIAEMLGITKKVAEYRIYSAFDKLKKELKGFNIK